MAAERINTCIGNDPPLTMPALPAGYHYRFHTIVKPGGARCNLACQYCFYLHKQQLLQQSAHSQMNDEMLACHIRQYIAAQTGEEVVFTWQGGEPTLLGLNFFRRVVALQQQYKKPDQYIENDLQTNGILLNDAWCEFLREHRFLVGLSLDGPALFHDQYRTTRSGRSTHARVMEAVSLLHKHQVPFNVLCVVNQGNSARPLDVYRFLRDEVRPARIQFLPGVEPQGFADTAPGYWNHARLPMIGSRQSVPGAVDSVVTDWSVSPEGWGMFLAQIWDEWLARDFGHVFVDQFENVISMMFGKGPLSCVTSEVCGNSLALEHNGDLYSCDHYAYPEYKLGNIARTHQGDLVFSEKQDRFAAAKSDNLPTYCQQCPYLRLCWGECPRNRFIKTTTGEYGLNYLCTGLRIFYVKAHSSYVTLASRLELCREERTP